MTRRPVFTQEGSAWLLDFTGMPTVLGSDLHPVVMEVRSKLAVGDHLTLKCHDIAFPDSRAIGTIIGWRKALGESGRLTLQDLNPQLAALLESLRLSPYLTLTSSKQAESYYATDE